MIGIFATSSFANTNTSLSYPDHSSLNLQNQPGFFRFSFDDVKMPSGVQNTGLVGMNYLADITPLVYGGIGVYGSVTGTQGGLFVLGVDGGVHKEFARNWWADAGLFVGGGGGRSAMVGGGLMLRPQVGIQYSWQWARFGLHYSYVSFPSGQIRSQQIGLDLDIPMNFYYVPFQNEGNTLFDYANLHLPDGGYLDFQRNDFAILLQNYYQKHGIHNTSGNVQDGTIQLVGAELDHYITQNGFWWVKTSGAYHGIPNGYMDILGGLGYHWALGSHGFAIVPQLGAGGGGGGGVDAGGGFLVEPELGLEVPFTRHFSGRLSGGYLWAPKGEFRAVTATGEIIYHLDVATKSATPVNYFTDQYDIQGWRVELLNQTYLHPQRNLNATNSSIELIALQVDQLITPYVFFSYQAASAYKGNHTGGYATGMLGPGLQTPEMFNQHVQLFGEVLVGTGGGGNIAISGGSIVEPVVGIHYALTPAVGLQASVGQLKSWNDNLNTPLINLGLTIRFGTVNQD